MNLLYSFIESDRKGNFEVFKGNFLQRKQAQAPGVEPIGGIKSFYIEKTNKFHAFFLFIGGVHNFIGDFQILLAKKFNYWRFRPTYWRK
ncbi:hypothetical protein [Mesobacillus jeotgali]|uniref:hypothetical protein n=1 Tax=Mesobacillus jeotgali TaxID=129985 RepID=UPI001CFD797B|nr:hypothetical protein [Mesobacillus jeotgali]